MSAPEILATRESLQATHFAVAASWCEEHQWFSGNQMQPRGLMVRLAPAVPEFESPFCAVGLRAQVGREVPREYSIGKREDSGHLVLFFAHETALPAVGASVRLVET